jgi:MFS family permease
VAYQLPRENWVLFAASTINRAGTMALPFLVLYLTRNLGFTSDQAALVLIGYGVGALITSPIAGRLCDWIGARLIMQLSFFFSGILLILFPLASQFTSVMAITIFWAVLSEAFRPASLAIITDLVKPEQRKAAFALNRLAINIGMSIGPAAGGFLAMISYPVLFWVNGATSLIAAIFLTWVPWHAKSYHLEHAKSADPSRPKPGILQDTKLLYFLISMLPVVIVFFQHTSSMPLFLVNNLHLQESAYGILFTINTGIIIFLEVSLNLAMAHWSHRKSLSLAVLLVAIGFGSMMFSTGFFTVAITVVIWTFGEMILFPGASAYMAELAPAARRGEYMGYYQMMFSFAYILGPWIGIQTYEHFGPTILWSGVFILGLISAFMMSRISNSEILPVKVPMGAEVVEHG